MPNMRHGTSTGATSLTMARDHQEHKIEQTMELHQHALTRTPAPEIKAYPSGRHLVPILVSLICVVFLVSLDMTIVSTAIPRITDEFRSIDKVSWYGSAYFMTFGGLQSASGKFLKYFPLKQAFLGSILVFGVGSLVCAVARGPTSFIVGRGIAGIGAAGIVTGAFTIVAFTAQPHIRPQLMGLLGAVYGLSSVLGPILGGLFCDKLSWRWCFYINLPVGAVSVLLIVLFFKIPRQTATIEASLSEKFLQMDPVGVTLVIGSMIAFILAVEYGGQTRPWNSAMVICLLAGSILMWIVFGCWETCLGERAMLVPRLVRQRFVWQPCAFQFFFAASYLVLLYYLPVYFQSVESASPTRSGVLSLPLVLSLALGSTVSGLVVSKTGHAAPFMLSGALLATASAALIYKFDIGTSMTKWIGCQFLFGAGVGLGFQMGINIAQANVEPQDLSSVTAHVLFFQTLGGVFSISSAQSAFMNRMLSHLASHLPSIDPQAVVTTGATQIRQSFAADEVPGVVRAYMAGVKITFALALGLAGITCLIGLCAPWGRLNRKALGLSAGTA